MKNIILYILLILTTIIHETVDAQVLIESTSTFYKNNTVTGQKFFLFIGGENSDTLVFDNKKFLIVKGYRRFDITNIYGKDTVHSFKIENVTDTSATVKHQIKNGTVCYEIKGTFIFDQKLDTALINDFIFINQLSKYNSALPEECFTVEFPPSELFSFWATTRYGNVFNSIVSETDSVFVWQGNKKQLWNFQSFKLKHNQIMSCTGFYLNSVGTIIKDTAVIIKGQISIKKKSLMYKNFNELNRESTVSVFKNNFLQYQKTKGLQYEGYTILDEYVYQGNNRLIIYTKDRGELSKKVEQVIYPRRYP